MFRHLSGCPSLTLQHLLQTALAGAVFYLRHQTRAVQTNPWHSAWQEEGAAVRQTLGGTKQGGTDSTHYSVFAQLPARMSHAKNSWSVWRVPTCPPCPKSSCRALQQVLQMDRSHVSLVPIATFETLMRVGWCHSFPEGCQSAQSTAQVSYTSCNAYPG